ncbi:MAG: response regulator [Asticcacaulis sp.]|nr:response regulator [Asticcacaulis sp.]
MTLHEGRIWCEPHTSGAYEGGARFLFTLPKPIAAAKPGPKVDNGHDIRMPTTNPSHLANVLLVDDREADAELTRVLLQVRDKLKFNLIVARGGQEALDTLRAAADRGDTVDLLLLDINMPGMNGFEMLERLRKDKELGRTAVVMCSGSTYDDDLARAEELGAAGYMVKPPSLEQLKPMLPALPGLRLHLAEGDNRLTRAA